MPGAEADLDDLLALAPGGRLVLRAVGDAIVIDLADPGACRLLMLPPDHVGRRLDAFVSPLEGDRLVPPLLDRLTLHCDRAPGTHCDLLCCPAGQGRWACSLVDVSEEMEARQHHQTPRHYLARLSDLALMFAFSYGIDESGIVEVACSAARRMAGAERAIYYRVETFSEEGIRAVPIYESRTLREHLVDHPATLWEVGPGNVDLVDDLAAGAVVRAVDALPDVLAEGMRSRGTVEVVMLPVVRTDNVGGVVMIESLKSRKWLLEELELLQAAMALFGSALDRMVVRLDLERSEAFSGSVVSAIADGILVVDADLSISMANPSAHRILGAVFDAASSAGRTTTAEALIAATLDADGAPLGEEEHPIFRALRRGESIANETLGLRVAGSEEPIWVQMSVQPLIHRGRSGESAVVTFSDTTERRTYERELLLARDAALDASRLKGAFLANMSHEIRTPMNGIIGTSALLLESGLDARQQEYALTLKGAAESLLTILDDVLDLSKIEAGRVDIERVPFEVLDLVDGVLDLLAPPARDKGLALGLHIDEQLCTRAVGDPHRLRQILNNLVGNALKFTDEGRVDVRVTCAARDTGDWLRIEVRDTGIGMSPETVERMFDRFTQADVSTTRRFGGTGLGLSICRQLIDLMGGQLTVESEEGVGSTFGFEVPTRVLGDATEARERLLAGTLVFVDVSDPVLGKLLTTHLRRWGARPALPGDGAEPTEIDLVIVDGERSGTAPTQLPRVRITAPGQASNEREVDWPPSSRELRRAVLAALRPADAVRPAVGTPSVSTGRARVLVVEDQHVNQLLARSMLELLGCEVEIAAHGAEAVAGVADKDFDVIFMDCQMPVMDGFEATRRIRETEGDDTRRVPIVAVSASAMGPERHACTEAGMDDFVAKPVRLEDFEAALHRWSPTASDRGPLSPTVAAPAVPELPLLDQVTLGRLRAVQLDAGGADLVSELAQLFISEGQTRLEQLSSALEASDAKALKAHAHSLKGSASTLGALRLSSACKELEKTAQDGAFQDAAERFAEIRRLYDETSSALREAC